MYPLFRNVLAIVVGVVIGAPVNMGRVVTGSRTVPPPTGVDVTTVEGLRAGMPLMQPMNFLFPFLAHSVGTLAGAFVAAKLAASRRLPIALSIGVVFLVGGVMMVYEVGGPAWFIAADLLLAYLPAAYLGAWLAGATKSSTA